MTSRRLRAFFWIFALFLAQNALDGVFPGGVPPLALVGVVFFALSEGPGFGLAAGAFAGFFFELFAVGRLGGQIAAFAAVGLFCGFASTKIFRDSLLTQLLLPPTALVLLAAANAALYGGPAFPAGQAALAAACSPPVFAFLKKTGGR